MDNLQEWIVPILSSIVAIAVAVMTCWWQMRTELRKILESYVSDKKYKAYKEEPRRYHELLKTNGV